MGVALLYMSRAAKQCEEGWISLQYRFHRALIKVILVGFAFSYFFQYDPWQNYARVVQIWSTLLEAVESVGSTN